MPGVFLRDYELLCELGQGGMARLSLARKIGIGGFEKLFAIKQILPELAARADFVRMFLDEARIVAGLQHANTVSVYEVGSEQGQVFLVMEFLHGHDLRTILHQGRLRGEQLPVATAVSIAAGICAGLHYAHEQLTPDGRPLGIVHRDVSPHNVFVTFDGVPKVIDFGVAKAVDRINKTTTTSLKGKLGYMSPEQARGDEIDRRSDVFAIGILLHEMLTGHKLFAGKSDYQLLKAVIEEPLSPPSLSNPAVPTELDRIVMKSLARDREQRHQTAFALQLELEDLARRRSFDLSPSALRAFMTDRHADEIGAWRDAQRRGQSLAAHFIETRRSQPLPVEPSLADSSRPESITATGSVTATASAAAPMAAAATKVRTRTPWLLALGATCVAIASIAWWSGRARITHVEAEPPQVVRTTQPASLLPSAPPIEPAEVATAPEAPKVESQLERRRTTHSRPKPPGARHFDPDAPLPR